MTNSISDTLINGTADADVIYNYGSNVTINSARGDDTIIDLGTYNSLNGGAGDDFLCAMTGTSNLTLIGGLGNDTVVNQGSNAYIDGGDGNDELSNYNNANDATINGGSGNDFILNDSDNVLIDGGADNDTLLNEGSYVSVNGNDGDDYIEGYSSAYYATLLGGEGNDTINNEGGTAVLLDGEGGNDWLNNQGVRSTVKGGAGSDTVANYGDNVLLDGGDGADAILNEGASVSVGAGNGNDYVENYGSNVTINGGAGNDSLSNYSTAVTLDGGAGNDVISNMASAVSVNSGAGDDTVENAGGNVTINAGAGNDVISLNSSGEIVQYGAGDGSDTVYGVDASDIISLGAGTKYTTMISDSGSDFIINVDNNQLRLVDASDVDFSIFGGVFDNIIRNTVEGMELNGTSDADTIFNFASNVTIRAGAGADFITNNADSTGAAEDVVIDGDVGNDTLINESARVSINAGDGKDRITNSGNNVTIRGGKGNDTVEGSSKNTTYEYASGDGNDVIRNLDNTDTLYIIDGSVYELVTVGSDRSVSIGTGSIKFKNASTKTINVMGGVRKINGTDDGDLFTLSALNGDQIIYGFDANDTLKASTGLIKAHERAGNDYVVTLTSGSTASKVTLSGAAGYAFTQSGGALIIDGIESVPTDYRLISNKSSKKKLSGNAGKDYIINSGSNVTIQAGGGNDIVSLSGSNNLIEYASSDGNDTIFNFGDNDTVQLTNGTFSSIGTVGKDAVVKVSGSSADGSITLKDAASKSFTINGSSLSVVPGIKRIRNAKANKKVTGTTVDDYIINTARNVTIQAGKGNDTIEGSNYGESFWFSYASDDDVITNFGLNDTIRCTGGSISSVKKVGDDTVITFKKSKTSGTVTLKNTAGYEFIQNGNFLTVDVVNTIDNDRDGETLIGTDYRDEIINNGEHVTIVGSAGRDTITGSDDFGELFIFSSLDGGNLITNFGKDDTIQIISGSITSTVPADDNVIIGIGDASLTLAGAAGYRDFLAKSFDNKYLIYDGPNFIVNRDAKKRVVGTASRDYIINTGSRATLNGASGNDTLVGSDNAEVFLFGATGGEDLITNFGANDTLYINSGSIESGERVGNDYIVNVSNGSMTGTVTLKGAGIYPFIQNGKKLTVDKVNVIVRNEDKIKVTGTTGRDYITTGGSKVTIQAGKGADTLYGSNEGDMFLFSYASGNDVILNFDSNDTLKSTSGTISGAERSGSDQIVTITKGKTSGTITLKNAKNYFLKYTDTELIVDDVNVIENDEDSIKVTGTTKRDYITNTGERVTIQAGKGDDTIEGSDYYGDRFLFSYASGNDVITNFGLNDTLKSTSGTLSYKQSGNDYVVTITKSGKTEVGTITLQGAAENYTLKKSGAYLTARRKTTSANVSEEGYWFLEEEPTVETSELNEIVSNDAAVDMPTDFMADALTRASSTLTVTARKNRRGSLKSD